VRAQVASVLVLLVSAPAAAGQQGSIQLSTATQLVEGDRQRRAGERAFEPDFGVSFLQPRSNFGELQLEVRGTRRGDKLHLGRASFAVRDAKARGISWTLEGGDISSGPALENYQFSNLGAASITFSGAAITAKTRRGTTQFVAGRSTAWRNIFGTDPDTLGQSLALARTSYEHNPRLQVNARAVRVRTWNTKEFARTIDASDQAGGGTRFVLTPSIHLAADGSFVRYRATGALTPVNDVSYLVGAHVLLSRGWFQVNRSRFAPGDFPVLNAYLLDRDGLFAAGEYDVLSRVRLFGGWDSTATNINPTGTSLLRPEATTNRGSAGVRVRVSARTSAAVRIEDGGRVAKPILKGPTPQSTETPTTSDTGLVSAELQSTIGPLSAFGRYARRDNVDSTFASSTFTQHDTSGQMYLNLSRRTQLFGQATLTSQRAASGSANRFVQLTAGAQQQVFRQGLWLRTEGTLSRSHDLTSDLLSPRNAFNVGLNGQISPQTTIGVNIYLDRAPVGSPGEKNAWLARSTLRLVHTIPTGTARVASASSVGVRSARGTGSVLGNVFADWNANGQPDPGEGTLAGIPVALGALAHVTTAGDGEFAFLNVPAGAQRVLLDLKALPVDFDPPGAPELVVELGRGDTRRVAFGLIPLGTIHGRVVEDTNRNGEADAGESPIEGAVLTLDGGQRSELARKGMFRFDAVRSGAHRLELLKESLPEGSVISGGGERPASITRERPQADLTYLVAIEKRPEVRKVFPAKTGRSEAPATNGAPVPPKASPAVVRRERPAALPDAGIYTIQVAAMNDSSRARAIVAELTGAGFAAYLVEPARRGAPYRVRVGHFATRASAQQMAVRIQSQTGSKPWVTTVR
jgi:sporulation related protein